MFFVQARAQGPEWKNNASVLLIKFPQDTSQVDTYKLEIFLPVFIQRSGRPWREAEFAIDLYSGSPDKLTKVAQNQIPGQAGVRS